MADHDKPYDFELKISSDYYEARLSVVIYESEELKISPEAVIDFLKSKNVVFGIDLDAIDTICQNPSLANNLLIATGIPHVNGENGEVTLYIDSENTTKPTMLANGNVDFKNLNLVHIAQKDELLAEKTLPTDGTSGTTVTGKIIKQKPGKPVNFKIGKNVTVSEDGLKLFSAVTGTIKLDGDKISVIEVLEIRNDIGVKTGNIFFTGKVIVYGNVTTGYSIECEELEINGIVESATIKCNGNVTISIGVQGNDAANIYCGGSLKAQTLNNCHLTVKGDIACDTLMHSLVICDGEIRATGRKGMIVGGEISARRAIRANIIGSEMGTTTSLKLGMDSVLLDEYKALTEQLKEAKDQCTKLDQLVRLLTKNVQTAPENTEMKDKLNQMIPARDNSYTQMYALTEKNNQMLELFNKMNDSFVTASTLYPGVKVKIGSNFFNAKDELKNVKLIKDGAHIVTIPN